MTEKQEPKKRKIPYLRLMLIFTVCITLVAIYTVCIYKPPLRISEETTRITGPLTADGQIDFFRYLEETTYPPEMATDENGFRIFVRTFGNYGEIAGLSEFYKEQRYKKLGLDRTIPPTMVFPESPQSLLLKLDPAGKQSRRIMEKPWTLEDVPVLTDWVDKAEYPMDVAAEMIRKPVFFCPYLQGEGYARSGKPQPLMTMLYPDVQSCREIARAYCARANYRLGTGKIDGAIDDTITLYQLGRKIGANGCLIEVLVGIAIEGIALNVPINANPNHQLTKEQLQRLLNAIDQLPQRQSFDKTIEIQRLEGLSVVQEIFRCEVWDDSPGLLFDGTVSVPVMNFLHVSSDQNVVYRDVNKAYDKIINEKTEWLGYTPFSTIGDYMDMLTPSGRGRIFGEIFCDLFLAHNGARGAMIRMECAYNMEHLTLALLLYKAEHGEFPKENWIEKIKPYLGDKIEQYLRCLACSTQDEGKTNYALVLYDNLPSDLDTLLLVELINPIPYEQATISVDDVLAKTNVGSNHSGGMNTARQSGAFRFISETENLQPLLGLEAKAVE